MFNGGGGGVPHEQFHQFMASTARTALPLTLPLTLPHNVSHSNQSSAPTYISTFDPHLHLSHHHHQQQQLFHESQLFHSNHPHQNTSSTHDGHLDEEKQEDCGRLEQLERGATRMRSVSDIMDPWEKEEVLALLRIRSNMGTNGFSDFIWGHVSRKLAELGFKRSAEKCKEKFEEMNQYNNNSTSYGNKNNYRSSFSELEALFEDQNPKSTTTTTTTNNLLSAHDHDIVMRSDLDGSAAEGKVAAAASLNLEENSGNETLENPYVENQSMLKQKQHRKKRKRNHKFEMLKGLCEEIVNKIMCQQEELHRKLLEDMERKEEERVSREEAWKNKEMDRINKEIEMRSQEQAIACDREATIIEFLKKLTTTTTTTSPIMENQDLVVKVHQEDDMIINTPQNPNPQPSSPSTLPSQNPSPPSKVSSITQANNVPKLPTSPIAKRNPSSSSTTHHKIHYIKPKMPNSSTLDTSSQNPSSSSTTTITTIGAAHHQDPSSNNTSMSERDQDHGKRWPRDEVNSLINLRCNVHSNGVGGGEDNSKESTKVPLWERISQGMLELGYKRSAKKCKEKWENINKYFRKTKDANKKRSLDSKTCPYFHQLNNLYNQGTLSIPSDPPLVRAHVDNNNNNNNQLPSSPESQSKSPEAHRSGVQGSTTADQGMVVHIDDHQGDEKNNISQVSPLEFEY